jgi:hypothetical protein
MEEKEELRILLQNTVIMVFQIGRESTVPRKDLFIEI